MGTATGHVESFLVTATLPILQLAEDFPNIGYIMPSLTNTLVGVGPICDADCTVLFAKHDVTVLFPESKPILTGCIEKDMPKLWHFSLRPSVEHVLKQTPDIK